MKAYYGMLLYLNLLDEIFNESHMLTSENSSKLLAINFIQYLWLINMKEVCLIMSVDNFINDEDVKMCNCYLTRDNVSFNTSIHLLIAKGCFSHCAIKSGNQAGSHYTSLFPI